MTSDDKHESYQRVSPAQPAEEQRGIFNPPYRYEVSTHGPATIYDAVDVGWIARVKESLPHKAALAAAIVDALNRGASSGGENE